MKMLLFGCMQELNILPEVLVHSLFSLQGLFLLFQMHDKTTELSLAFAQLKLFPTMILSGPHRVGPVGLLTGK